MRSARSVISSRLPMGVGTINRVFTFRYRPPQRDEARSPRGLNRRDQAPAGDAVEQAEPPFQGITDGQAAAVNCVAVDHLIVIAGSHLEYQHRPLDRAFDLQVA